MGGDVLGCGERDERAHVHQHSRALAYVGNLGFLQVVAGYILGRIVVASCFLPRYYKGELVTAYALLEKRFGLATRRFTSIVFMVTRGSRRFSSRLRDGNSDRADSRGNRAVQRT